MLHRQVSADSALAEGALDIATGGYGQVNPPYLIVRLLVKAGVVPHNLHR
jgi:hypothetical protein